MIIFLRIPPFLPITVSISKCSSQKFRSKKPHDPIAEAYERNWATGLATKLSPQKLLLHRNPASPVCHSKRKRHVLHDGEIFYAKFLEHLFEIFYRGMRDALALVDKAPKEKPLTKSISDRNSINLLYE